MTAALAARPFSRLRPLMAPGAALGRGWWRLAASGALRSVSIIGGAAWAASPWRPLLRFWLAILAVAAAGGAVLQWLGPMPPPERPRGEQASSEPLRSAEADGSRSAATPTCLDAAAAPVQPGPAQETASPPSAPEPPAPAPSRSPLPPWVCGFRRGREASCNAVRCGRPASRRRHGQGGGPPSCAYDHGSTVRRTGGHIFGRANDRAGGARRAGRRGPDPERASDGPVGPRRAIGATARARSDGQRR